MKIRFFSAGLPGLIVEGFHYPVVTDKSGRCLPPLSDYIITHIANNSWRSPSTARTKAERIVDFLAYCEDNSILFETLTVDTITKFRKFKLTVGLGGKPAQAHVVNQTVDEVKRFWNWGCAEGYFKETSPVGVSEYRTDTRGTPAFNDLNLPTAEMLGHFCGYLRSPESRIAISLGYSSGLRRAEIVGLDADSIRPIAEMDRANTGAVLLRLDGYRSPTKGGVSRVVEVPPLLYTHMYTYRLSFRESRLAGRPIYERPASLLVSKYGNAFQPKWLNEVCAQASMASGIDIWPHLLRHWYATRFIEYEQHSRFGGSERKTYATLQKLLGHRFYETTLLYAHLATEQKSDIGVELGRYQTKLSQILSASLRGVQ